MKPYQKIEASRETRLWLMQVVVPLIGVTLAVVPEARHWAVDKTRNAVDKIRSKFRKEEEVS